MDFVIKIFGLILFAGIYVVAFLFFLIPGIILLSAIFTLFKNHKWPKIILGSISNALLFTPAHAGGAAMFFCPVVLAPISEYVTFADLFTEVKITVFVLIFATSIFVFTYWHDRVFFNGQTKNISNHVIKADEK